MRFYVCGEFYSSADDEECSPIRRSLICAMQIGISDRRRVVFRMFEIIYAFIRVWRILLVGRRLEMFAHPLFADVRHADRNIWQAMGCLSDVRE